MTPLLIHSLGPANIEILRSMRQDWELVGQKRPELGIRCHSSSVDYKEWIKLLIERIKLPFNHIPLTGKKMPDLATLDSEEVIELRKALASSEEEKRSLKRKLMKAYEEQKIALEQANRERRFSKSINKKAKWEEKNRIKIKECLVVADWEMSLKRDGRNQLLSKKLELEEELRNSQVAKQKTREQCEDVKQQLEDMGEQENYKVRAELGQERRVSQDLDECAQEIFFELKVEIIAWKRKFVALADLAKGLLETFEDGTTFWKDRSDREDQGDGCNQLRNECNAGYD
ncbi:hypothetical protein CR513_37530, partial [Mucuna pruriens]